jgi:hypothetical protein
MQITVGQLRKLLASAVAEAKIAASAEYMQKERVRETVQQQILDLVRSGDIASQRDLDAFVKSSSGKSPTIDLALGALKMVPFEVYAKMAKKSA